MLSAVSERADVLWCGMHGTELMDMCNVLDDLLYSHGHLFISVYVVMWSISFAADVQWLWTMRFGLPERLGILCDSISADRCRRQLGTSLGPTDQSATHDLSLAFHHDDSVPGRYEFDFGASAALAFSNDAYLLQFTERNYCGCRFVWRSLSCILGRLWS